MRLYDRRPAGLDLQRVAIRALASSVICVLSWGIPHPSIHAAAGLETDPWEDYGKHVAQAEQAFDAGEILEAIAAYSSAYEALPLESRVDDFGREVVTRVLLLIEEAWSDGVRDPAMVEKTLELVGVHRQDVERRTGTATTEVFAEERTLWTTRLAEVQSVAAPPAEDEDERVKAAEMKLEPEPTPSPRAQPQQGDLSPDRGKARGLGIGLMAGGGAVAVAGIALLARGAVIGNIVSSGYQKYSGCPDTNDVARCQEDGAVWREKNTTTQKAVYASGAALAAIGVAALIWGTVVCVKTKRNRSVSMVPGFSDGPYFSMVGRF